MKANYQFLKRLSEKYAHETSVEHMIDRFNTIIDTFISDAEYCVSHACSEKKHTVKLVSLYCNEMQCIYSEIQTIYNRITEIYASHGYYDSYEYVRFGDPAPLQYIQDYISEPVIADAIYIFALDPTTL